MYATRHAVFVGPGKLPGELRDVLHRRVGAPQPDIAIQVPRLLALFETAAEAERVASQVQRLKLGAVVAGPEQPPADAGWAVARTLEFFDGQWRVTSELSDVSSFVPSAILGVTQVDWRPVDGAADRAVLLTLRDLKPVLLRASRLDAVSAKSVPLEGMRRISEFLEAAALEFSTELRVRTRRLSEADFQPETLTGDLLPLVVGVVDAVDTHPGELPRPLARRVSRDELRALEPTALGRTSAWVLHVASLGGLLGSLALLGVAGLQLGLVAGAAGLVLGAWATRRFMWARWLSHENWGDDSPIPPWPISPEERGIEPHVLELLLDVGTIATLGYGLLQEGAVQKLCALALPLVLSATVAAGAATWDARQRR